MKVILAVLSPLVFCICLLSASSYNNYVTGNHIAHISDSEMKGHLAKWKIVKAESVFKSHVSDTDKRSYEEHINAMVKEGYIKFITENTYVAYNGLFEISGTYEIKDGVLKTKNQIGFPINYVLVELTDSSLIYQSIQKDLTLTLYHKKQND